MSTEPVGFCGELSQSSAVRAHTSPGTREGLKRQPSSERSGAKYGSAPAKRAPPSYTGYAGVGITTVFFGPAGSTTASAMLKMASLRPFAGST